MIFYSFNIVEAGYCIMIFYSFNIVEAGMAVRTYVEKGEGLYNVLVYQHIIISMLQAGMGVTSVTS